MDSSSSGLSAVSKPAAAGERVSVRKKPWTKFEQIYQYAVEQIATGEEPMYRPGEVFPAASTLATRFGVSTSLVQKVVKALKEDGYLAEVGPGHRPRVRRQYPREAAE